MAANAENLAGAVGNLPPFKHFFKVIWPEAIRNKKLLLPQKFAMTYKGELNHEVRLEVPNTRVWRVGLTRERGDENRVWLDSGFGDFIRFYSIVARHCLIFKYNGHSHFEVAICDCTACEITYPSEEPLTSSGEDGHGDDSESEGDEAGGEEYSGPDDDEAGGEEEEDSESDGGDEEEDSESDGSEKEGSKDSDSKSDEEEHLGGRNFTNGNGKGKRVETETVRGGDGSWSYWRFTKRPAGTTSASQGNRGKRPRLAEEHSDSSADSQSDDHRRAGKGKRVATGNGASGSRCRRKVPSTATRLPQTSSEGDKNLRIRLLASKIVTITRFWWSFMELSTRSKIAIQKAIDCSNPENPSLLIVIKKTHIRPGIINMPAKFANKHFGQNAEKVTIRVYEENERFVGEWLVTVERDRRNLASFKGGWGRFCAGNRLVEGDVCLFHLVDQKKKIFNVDIFRA